MLVLALQLPRCKPIVFGYIVSAYEQVNLPIRQGSAVDAVVGRACIPKGLIGTQ
jgi:hypothetical protein